jgi:endonuclease-8
MSPKWSTPKAVRAVRALGNSMVCDVLMDQTIFAGVGNIIKNEVLFRQLLHPETRVEQLTPKQVRSLVADTRAYCLLFYKWKKANVLKRNWQIMRKRNCPICGGPVTKKPTGKLQRLSHWCRVHQPKPGTVLAKKRGGGSVTPARKKKVVRKLTMTVKR